MITSVTSVVNGNYDMNKSISDNNKIVTNNEYSKDSKERRQSSSMFNSDKPEYIEAETVSLWYNTVIKES